MKMPRVESAFFPFGGGLDLQTPSMAIKPGRCVDAKNYVTNISGGYERLTGYERHDGQASPSDATYIMFPVVKSGIITIGNTITGATSGATCKVLSLDSDTAGYLVCGRLTGTFVSESIKIGGVVVGTTTGAILANGASTISADADYTLLAANDLRDDILAVPGSGITRGLAIYNDVLYAFTDNFAGTAGDMYKSTPTGWVKINFPYELQFNTGTAAIAVGDTVTDASGAVSAVVTAVLLRSGTYSTNDAAGTLIFASISGGSWAASGQIKVGGVQKATAAAASTQITRLPGGKVETYNYNFTGSTATLKMYGADGVNPAFEFDGTNYYHIRTGMATDTPSHVIGYKKYLFLSFLGSIQKSAVVNPYSWTAVLGANEITTGEAVTGFLPMGGDSNGSSLAIFTKGKTFTLYGSTTTDFQLANTTSGIGVSAYTMQLVGADAFGMTARGIQAVQTTQRYGDFLYASISHEIQPYITAKAGLEVSSTVLQTKNQYRVYFSDGTGLAVGLTGGKVNGLMPLDYGIPVHCIVTATLSTGEEVTYFGSDTGYIYRDNIGTSFDGDPIEHWVRLPFNHEGSPRMRKRWRRAVLELTVERYCEFRMAYDLGYGNSNVAEPALPAAQMLSGGGAYWDQINGMNWDSFTWDVQTVLDPTITLDGTEKNISLLFYGNRAQDKPHVLQGATIFYTPRRAER